MQKERSQHGPSLNRKYTRSSHRGFGRRLEFSREQNK